MKKLLKFLGGIFTWIKDLFSKLPTELKKAVQLGVLVTEGLKVIIDSPAADVITALVPGQTDDKLKDWLRANLPGILAKLKLIDSIDLQLPVEQLVLKAAKELSLMDSEAKSAFLHNLAILVAKARSDGKLTWSDGVYLLEWVYQQEKEKQLKSA